MNDKKLNEIVAGGRKKIKVLVLVLGVFGDKDIMQEWCDLVAGAVISRAANAGINMYYDISLDVFTGDSWPVLKSPLTWVSCGVDQVKMSAEDAIRVAIRDHLRNKEDVRSNSGKSLCSSLNKTEGEVLPVACA